MQLKYALLAVDLDAIATEAVALQLPRPPPRRRATCPSAGTHKMEKEVHLALRGMQHIICQAYAHRRGFCI